MCGIAGILSFDLQRPVAFQALEKMAAALYHRGPDGQGYYTDPQSPGLGFAHTRLAIVDLAGGAQPMSNEDQSIWVVFNGEIFNHVELRRQLIARGHRFATQSDTEVLVHLYEDRGENFVDELNGQFAIALWDCRARKLILVRDRPGILPLYFHQGRDRLTFASEIKAILPTLDERPRADPAAFAQLMTFWAPLTPNTVFEGVKEVEPGQMLCFQDGAMRARHYWRPSLGLPRHDGEVREEDLIEELGGLLEDATRIRLRADVPVGCYLSGGLDSSLLVGMVSANRDVKLRTFSIGFDDPKLDESQFQREVSQYLGTDHTQAHCGPRSVADIWLDTIRSTETPVLRTGPAPMRLLSQHARSSGYKVVLTGEGADEIFGGYDIFKEAKIRAFCAQQPESAWRPLILKRLYPYLDFTREQSTSILKSYFGALDENPDALTYSHRPRWSGTSQVMTFLSPEFSEQVANGPKPETLLEEKWGSELRGLGRFQRAQFLELGTLMAGYLLSSQGDRMLMANSVEGRFPYLDHRVMELAHRLSPRMKMKVLNEKYLLKKIASTKVPAQVLKRQKQPYQSPATAAFLSPTLLGNRGNGGRCGQIPDYVDELMSERKLREYGYLHPGKIKLLTEKIKDALAKGRPVSYRDNTSWIFALSMQVWHRNFQVLEEK